MIKHQKSTLLLVILLIFIFSTTASATFTTGEGNRTYKIDSFRVDPQLRLQSFLVGVGINDQTALNFKLTAFNDEEQPIDFIYPGQNFKEGYSFYPTEGPIFDVMVQYIPRHSLFVTESSLNAVQAGFKNYRGDILDEDGDRPTNLENSINQTYFVVGILSRSRWDDHNLFSDLNIAYDPDLERGGFLFDSQIGMEFNLRSNFRGQISYRAIGTLNGSASGVSLGLKVDY
ncbi:hypothetical protein MWH25_03365 [Natroniella acetigena]|uniref:hypothetical protein n=1 Tax=Natroniella acetigena TaxID=52004 RepID=UPI00200A4333|nr:hypothetical protein [Natroniella acetigena]MCK8826784.1 hypothetical protein [Natroniella acetigena]